MELAGRMVFLRYDDIPGQIGKIGTLFGEAAVNIANMAVSRNREGGKALMALSVDSAVPDTLVDALRGSGFDDVRVVQLA
jgi:D-3-phosphoglycerate dehydrogenase